MGKHTVQTAVVSRPSDNSAELDNDDASGTKRGVMALSLIHIYYPLAAVAHAHFRQGGLEAAIRRRHLRMGMRDQGGNGVVHQLSLIHIYSTSLRLRR